MAGQKILVVDDEERILELTEKILTAEGYDIITVTNGMDAIHQAKTNAPDLIIMDIILPDMDGPETVQTLQLNPQTESIPVIFMSGIVGEETEKKSEVKVGSQAYPALGKPFTKEVLMEEIRAVLG